MFVDKRHKLSKVVAKDETRYAIRSAKLCGEGGQRKLVATDGRRLAVIPVTDADADETDALVPGEALKAAEKGGKRFPSRIDCNGTVRVTAAPASPTVEFPKPDDARFPEWEQIVPDYPSSATKISLNAKMLYELALALGDEEGCVTLTLDPDGSGPIHVEPIASTGAFGLLMPIGEG